MERSMDRLVLVGENCIKSKKLRDAIKVFAGQFEICFSDTGIEYAGSNDDTYDVIMVYDDFTDKIFSKLNSHGCYIVGPQVVLNAVECHPPVLQRRRRPVYNNAMEAVVICFTGFNNRAQISELAMLVHYMSGAIRKDFNTSVTHLVANHCKGDKYKKAVSFGKPIMQHDWIYQLWEKRGNPGVTANSPEMMQYRAPPFFRCGLAFYGFSEEDLKEMEEIAMSNGGQLCQIGDSCCTHLVVDNIQTLPSDIHTNIYVVKAEWFWASVQMEACADERVYLVEEGRENTPSKRTPVKSRYSLSRSKKRKRYLRENLAALASEGEAAPPPGSLSYKSRRSSADQLSASLMSGDTTPDSSGCLLDKPRRKPRVSYLRALDRDSPSPCQVRKVAKSPTPDRSQPKPSAKKLVVCELLQTEVNYCGILSNIVTIFRDEAEKADQPGGPILTTTDSKIIFGKIPPIYEVHKEIRADLEALLHSWSDDAIVADVILNKAEKLRQTYPPFVNYMEKTKEKIAECMKTNHRFHAFMKVCERRPECGRQSLPDLMMSIVQRLPRIELLLQQIHKYTDRKSPDYHKLELAQSDLKDVMMHINEDKRITNERMVLFEIMNDIDNCPPNLLSASRNFIYKLDVDEVSDELIGRGEHITLFLFSDSLEIVKRRHKTTLTPFKSPSTSKPTNQLTSSKSKPYKHLEFLTLPSIKRILDITVDEALTNDLSESNCPIFSLLCRSVTDTREKLYTFQIQDLENIDKSEFITLLAKTIANCFCRTDYETLITERPAADFMITPLENNSSNKTMTKAVSKFGKRLSRAMTIKGVPSPLKRAVSTIMTPTRRSSIRRTDTQSSVTSTTSMWELDVSFEPCQSINADTSFSTTATSCKTSGRRKSIINRVRESFRLNTHGRMSITSNTQHGETINRRLMNITCNGESSSVEDGEDTTRSDYTDPNMLAASSGECILPEASKSPPFVVPKLSIQRGSPLKKRPIQTPNKSILEVPDIKRLKHRGSSPQLNEQNSPVFMSYSTLPRNVSGITTPTAPGKMRISTMLAKRT